MSATEAGPYWTSNEPIHGPGADLYQCAVQRGVYRTYTQGTHRFCVSCGTEQIEPLQVSAHHPIPLSERTNVS